MRHLPVYILIDTSGSMKGEPIESVKVGLADMIATLRQDPYALETVCISIITFNNEVKQMLMYRTKMKGWWFITASSILVMGNKILCMAGIRLLIFLFWL